MIGYIIDKRNYGGYQTWERDDEHLHALLRLRDVGREVRVEVGLEVRPPEGSEHLPDLERCGHLVKRPRRSDAGFGRELGVRWG